MSMNDKYVIIVLIGNTPDDQIDANIIDGYYQPIFANLIRDFAIDIYNIKKESVKILAIGKEQNYSVYTYSNNKYYFKLDVENTFQIDIKQRNTNFQYFTEFNSAIDQICKMISNNKNKKVILFLDDHGDDGYFAQIHYFHLYEITMRFNNTSFLIFNDSCYSGSFIDFAESYNDMLSLIESKNLLGIKAQLLFAFKNIFEYAIEKVGFDKSKEKVLELIKFYQSIKIDEEEALNLIKNNSFLDEVNIDTTQLIFGSYKLIDMGFENNEQINIFKTMINFYGDVNTDEKDEFKYYKNIFNIANFNKFINLSEGNIPQFINKLNIFYVIKDSINFDLLPNKHVEIITSTDNLHKSLSFSSIRVNNSIKISPGGPAMGSFIKTLFIKNDPKSINFEEVKKEISQSDDETIYYPLRTTGSVKNGKKERQLIHLYPKHYKLSDKDDDVKYSFTYSRKLKQKIATIRAISYLNVQKLIETAKNINSNVNIEDYQHFNDTYGSIFAISALLNKYNEPNEMIEDCFKENEVIKSHKPNIINSYCFILDLSFRISNKNPESMTGTIINILEKAVKHAIKKKIDLIIENRKSGKNSSNNFTNKIFLDREMSDLLINQRKDLTEFKDNEFPFLKQIEKVIISLISIPQVAFAAIIASSLLLKEIDLNTINEMTLSYIEMESNNIFHDPNQIYNQFLTNINKCENEEDIRKVAEYYLLEMIDASFAHVYSIFDAQFKCDSMKIVSYSLTNFSATSIVDVMNIYLKSNESFINHIIGPIEQKLDQNNIPNFYIPTILSLMPQETVIYALYMSLSGIENDWFNNLLQIIKIVKEDESFKDVYNELYSLAKEKLSNQKCVQTCSQYEKSTKNLEGMISNEIEKAIGKLYKLQKKSIIKARENISKQMGIDLIEDQIKLYVNNIICNDTINSKYDMYLKESKEAILNIEKHQIKLSIDLKNIPTEKSIFNESILDIQNICERASKELITVAHLFKISDESRNETNSNLSKKIKDKASIELPVIAMAARALNIVEMTPIVNILPRFLDAFDQSEGEKPNLKELLALLSANIHILSPKDAKRKCFKKVKLTNNIKIEDNEPIDSDSYDYIDNDEDEDDKLILSTLKAKSLNKAIPHRKMINSKNNDEILKYYEYQIDYIEIKKARDLLNIGQSSWTNDAWKAFLYCFNLRMKDLGIQFNLSYEYDKSFCPFKIDEGINIVLKFYPITRIHEIFQNKEKFNCFIGQYSKMHEEIIQAFIRSFDDVDLIVTSLYFRKRTYFDRTLEKLKIIYDYPYSKTSKM